MIKLENKYGEKPGRLSAYPVQEQVLDGKDQHAMPSFFKKGLSVCLFIVFFSLCFHQVAFAQNPDIFYYVSDGNDRLYSINRITGANVNIGATASNIEALAYFPIPGQQTLYAANGGELGTINISTGAYTSIGDIDGGGTLSGFVSGVATEQSLSDVDGLMFDGQSLVLWGIERNGGPDILFQINRTTGEFIPDAFGAGVDYVEITGPGIDVDVDDLAVDPRTGEIYGVSNNGGTDDVLFRVNKSTGVFTVVSTLSENDIEGLSFSNDGRLYGSDGTDERLGEINIATGVFTVVQDLDGDDVESLAALVADANLISGNVFDDLDKDGIKDGGDVGIEGVTLYLFVDQNGDGTIDPEDTRVQSTVTDSSGDYEFFYVTTGTLLISTEPDTWGAGGTTRAITTDNIEAAVFTDAVNFGETDINNDFGLGSFTPLEDCDGDGLPDFFEGTVDSDGDGIQDQCDLDSDNDGIRDDVEGAGDFDDDGIPNYIDRDSDDDGIPDAIEANRGVIRAEYVAADGNLSGVDADNDGIIDSIELPGDQLPTPYNSDNDDNPDYLDLDSDNDGILDIREAGGTGDTDGDGQVDSPTDANNNGYADALETTPLTYPNTDSAYETTEGLPLLPNYIDIDSDNDGIDDTREGQSTSGYGFPSIISDVDEDGIIDFWDVSSGLDPIVPYDNDFDGTPDYIDLDSDNDGEGDIIEGNDADFNGVADTVPLGVDANGNGLDDAFDAGCVIAGVTTDFSLSDHAEEDNTDGSIDLTSGDLELVNESNNQTIGIRFTNVTVDQGVDIASASVQFQTDETSTGALTITIRGQLSTNAPAFTTAVNNVSSRSLTVASETWSPADWNTVGEAGANQRTVDISSIIEEIVGQPGWSNGNAIVLIFTGPSGTRTAEDDPTILTITTSGGPAQVCSSNVSLPDEDTDGEYDFRETDGSLDSDFDGIADDIDIDDDNDGITDMDENAACKGLLSYEFYDGLPTGETVDNIPTTGALGSGTVTNFDVNSLQSTVDPGDADAYGIRYSGFITIATSETYTFFTSSDDGSKLFIGGTEVVDNDGSHGIVEQSGTIALTPGVYPFEVLFFENTGGASLSTSYETATISKQVIPFSVLSPTNCDSDGDGIVNRLDLDSDNDGILDITEAGGGSFDTNNDGRVDTYIEGLGPDGLSSVFEPGRVGNSSNLPNLDTDDDGFKDFVDLDSDNDGIFDILEAGGQDLDLDQDGRVDNDTDGDNDGIANAFDINNSGSPLSDPDTDGDSFPNRVDIDSDADGIVDVIESQASTGSPVLPTGVDADDDGIDNAFDDDNGGTPTVPVDTDGDDTPDYLDINSDNDGLVDAVEGWDTNGDSSPNTTPAGTDADGDGLDDNYDTVNGRNSTTNVYDTPGIDNSSDDYPDETTPDTTERDWREVNVIDTDLDGVPDSIDIDDDNDGVLDVDESAGDCSITTVVSQTGVTNPGNVVGAVDGTFATIDTNGDIMVVDLGAEYPAGTQYEITWKRTDGETGTAIMILRESTSPASGFVDNPSFPDVSVGTFETDVVTSNVSFRYLQITKESDPSIVDFDIDAIVVVCDIDTDGDGIPDRLDLDSDNDGIFDIIEAGGVDSNTDGRVDVFVDGNGNGWANVFDPGNGGTIHPDPDTDMDGLENRIDSDSDGDGITDLIESQVTAGTLVVPVGVDSDQDGIDNAFDINCVPCGAVTGVPTVPVNTDAGFVISDLVPDYLDTDSDNDGLGDIIEGWDTNGNYAADVTPLGTDADGDGLDDAFDDVVGPNPITNPTNSQTANSFPNITTVDATTERDWREINNVTCAPGEVDGNLMLWLRADQGGTNWLDQSNNFVSLTRTGTATVGSMNFNPTNTFNGSTYYTTNLSINSDANPNLAVIAVYKPSSDDAGPVWGENDSSFDRYMQDASGQNNAVSNGSGTENDIPGLFADGVTTLSTVIFAEDVADGSQVFVNGENELSFTANHGSETSNNLQIGAIGTGLTRFNGEIAEVIVYDQLLSSSNDRQKIESYLALKYGITLSPDTDGDDTAFEAGEGDYLLSNGTAMWDADELMATFQNNIAGIARDDESCLVQLQSQSENSDAIVAIGLDSDSDGLETSNALNESSFSTDLSALVWGHDGSSLYDPNNQEFDNSQVRTRLNREWRVQETGTVGTVTVRFDVSGLLGPTGVGTNDETKIVMLVDADGDFSSGAALVSQSFEVDADGFVSFQVDFSDGVYFTLASGELGALPVTLLSFTAASDKNYVQLKWTTTSETENSFFRVERSQNGVAFEAIGLLDGAGTSLYTNNYSFIDANPLAGLTFYRLIDIDKSGVENTSEIVSVKFKRSTEAPKAYPNPAVRGESLKLNISRDAILGKINMYDLNGKSARISVQRLADSIVIQPLGISSGIYVLLVSIDGELFRQRVIIK